MNFLLDLLRKSTRIIFGAWTNRSIEMCAQPLKVKTVVGGLRLKEQEPENELSCANFYSKKKLLPMAPRTC